MVSWSKTETELLLKLVHERNALYDVANHHYTNRDVIWALWTDIAGQQTSSKLKRKVKWPWAHLMTFLIPHLKIIQPRYRTEVGIDESEGVVAVNDYKTCSTNSSNGNELMSLNNFSEDFESNNALDNSDDVIEEYLYYDSSVESDPSEQQSANKSSLKCIKMEEMAKVKSLGKSHKSRNNSNYEIDGGDEYVNDDQTAEYYQTQEVTNLPTQFHQCDQLAGADADEMFFMSIVPDVKLLSPRDKGIFKIKVQQMLHEMLYSSNEENSTLENNSDDSMASSSPSKFVVPNPSGMNQTASCMSTCYQLTRGEGKPSTFHNCCTVTAYKRASKWQRENGQWSDDLLTRPKGPTDQRQMRLSIHIGVWMQMTTRTTQFRKKVNVIVVVTEAWRKYDTASLANSFYLESCTCLSALTLLDASCSSRKI
ncbi:hypothetical protein C0J52_04191 [Blattella germanica]|nr:hypothetical protein C0J52_04191 [Blattella germanica]